MERFYTALRDVQRDAPVAQCSVCGQEIYKYAEVASVDGNLVHEQCLTSEELEDYATAPACAFFQEAC